MTHKDCDADVFVLTDEDGRIMNPVRQAAVFAQYARSPKLVRELLEFTDENSAEGFQEKWIVGFGHNSIAELATLPVAFDGDGVSMAAAKFVERWQRPGACERSTRMQQFTEDSVLIPSTVPARIRKEAEPLIAEAFVLYRRILNELPQFIRDRANMSADPSKWDPSKTAVTKMTFDAARYLLPVGSLTRLGICAYPRDISQMISQMRGQPGVNTEILALGDKLQAATEKLGGPLIRHTEPDTWTPRFQPVNTHTSKMRQRSNKVRLQHVRCPDPHSKWLDDQVDIYDALLHLVQDRTGMSQAEFEREMSARPPHVEVPDLFKSVQMRFIFDMDYGAFRDLQRHRRLTQFVEPLTNNIGFVVPQEIQGTHLERPVTDLLERFEKIEWVHGADQLVAQYVLPMAFLVRFEFEMDLKEAYYLIELRSQPAGHVSYREAAQRMFLLLDDASPQLMQWCRVNKV